VTQLDRLHARVEQLGSSVCVGLDPRFEAIPDIIKQEARRVSERDGDVIRHSIRLYHELILDTVGQLVPAVKLQLAFYEQYGLNGMKAYVDTMAYAKAKGVFAIADAKRSDVPATSEAYAQAFLNPSSEFGADAMTIVPYIGMDSMMPYFEAAERYDRSVFVVVKTSNPGSGDVQDIKNGHGQQVFELVCEQLDQLPVAQKSNVGLVVACSRYSDAAYTIRRRLPNISILVVGYGAQGGSAHHVVPLFTDEGKMAIVNSSRQLTYRFDRAISSLDELRAAMRGNLHLMQSEILEALNKRAA
jgi:orotidine-5'-phosphate decarboxylase